jgi:hypothetical protein
VELRQELRIDFVPGVSLVYISVRCIAFGRQFLLGYPRYRNWIGRRAAVIEANEHWAHWYDPH